jgi:hypothetical protein
MMVNLKVQESNIRADVRRQYREEGNTENPYDRGTIQSIIWDSEETRIYIEGMECCE